MLTAKPVPGIGIAAPQVGVSLSVVICWDGESNTKPVLMINPSIVETFGEEESGTEGCLSFPDLYIPVSRAHGVVVKYQNIKGKWEKLRATGMMSRCILHEVDHLSGILFTELGELNAAAK